MRKNNKLILVCIALAFCTVASMAADVRIKKPHGKEIVIIGSLFTKTAMNEEFYSRYFTFGKVKPANTIWYIPQPGMVYGTEIGKLGDLFYLVVSVPKDGTIRIPSLTMLLYNSNWANIDLPLNIEVTVPEGAKYLYIGSFGYEFSDMYFDIKEINQYDEFDDAQVQAKLKFGKDVELTRAAVKEISK